MLVIDTGLQNFASTEGMEGEEEEGDQEEELKEEKGRRKSKERRGEGGGGTEKGSNCHILEKNSTKNELTEKKKFQ